MKRKVIIRSLVILALVGILSGCASTTTLKNGPTHYGAKIDLTMRPEQSLGVRVTPALESGEVTVIETPMTDSQVGGEMYPGRIAFPGIAVSEKGEIAFAQYVLVGNYQNGDFMAFVIIDGKFNDMKSAKFLPLSSRTEYTWSKIGDLLPIDRAKFYEDKQFLQSLVRENGISVSERHSVKGFDKIVRSWNRYATAYGDIYSPLGEEDIKRVAKINPGYSAIERLVLRNKAVISINPIEMVAKASITVLEAMKSKTQGWDYCSELPTRAQMAMIVEFIGRFRKEMIQELNEKVARQEAEISAIKKPKQIVDDEKVVSVQKLTKKRSVK